LTVYSDRTILVKQGETIMKHRTYFLVTGTVFGLVSLLHLIRLVLWLPVRIGPWNVSYRISAIAFIIAGLLCFLGFRLAKKK
jgi:hypothetical protein